MTINTGYAPNKYAGNGVTTDFSIDWNPVSVDFIKVVLENRTTGEQEVKTLGVDYTATITDNDGIVSFMTAPSSSYNIILSRDVSLTQEVSYSQNNSYRGTLHEDSLDKIVAQNQQQAEELGRSAKLPLGSDISSLELPNPEAGKALKWNANEDGLINTTDDVDEIVTLATAQATIATTKASEASASASSAAGSVTTAQGLINGFGTTVTNATTTFNTNATTKTNDFNANATAKQALVDSAAASAQNSATSAQQYAQDTKGFAPIGSFISIPCTADYIPDGCLPCDGTEYTKEQFKTFWTNYLTSSPVKLQTCTYAEYATAISTYGFCDKFAVDTVNNTFKVPTRPNKQYIGVNSTAPVIGNGMTLGLNDGTDNTGITRCNLNGTQYMTAYNDLYGTNTGTTATGGTIARTTSLGVTTDPTKSGIIADTSNLIKESTDIRWFVVVANAQINQSQMDWSAWATSLAGKANTDMDNITATGKETVVGWGMPDYSAGVSSSSGVAQVNSWYKIACSNYNDAIVSIGGQDFTNRNSSITTLLLPVPKGVSYSSSNGGILYPCKGVN